MSKHLIRVLNLGKRSFDDVLRTQEVLRQRVIAQNSISHQRSLFPFTNDVRGDGYPGEPENFLILVEHWPVYTAG